MVWPIGGRVIVHNLLAVSAALDILKHGIAPISEDDSDVAGTTDVVLHMTAFHTAGN